MPNARVRAQSTAALGFACVASLASGCTRLSTAGTAQAGNPWTHHGRLVYASTYEAKNLDPLLSSTTGVLDLSYFLFSYAVRYDDRARPVPDALREVPTIENGDVSNDGLTLKYKLRPNVYFHDGVRLTCRDLAFTWRAVMNPANNDVSQDGYRDIASIDCRDPLVAVVHMKRVYAPFLETLWGPNGNAPILPEHILAKFNDRNGSFNTAPFQSAPIGSGPFAFARWDRGQQVVMKAFDRYFLGRPKLDEVVYRYIPQESTIVDEMKTHEIDMAVHVTAPTWPQLKGIPGTVARAVPVYIFDHVDFNLRQPVFADVAVRRALSLALDRRTMARDVAHGLSDQSDTALSPVISWAWTSDTAHYDYDPAAAAKMLDAAGWKTGSDGIRAKAGVRLAFDLTTQTESTSGRAYETVVQSQWHAIGAEVSIKNFPTAQLFDNAPTSVLQGGHYDSAIYSWSGAADPDDSALYSGHDQAPHGQNTLFWNDPIATAAMDAELATVDRAKRLRAFAIEQQQFASQVPSIDLGYRREPEIYNSDLRGYSASPVISPFWDPQNYSL